MKVARQAVAYYCAITGKVWSDFFENLDDALNAENPTDEQWLIKELTNTIIRNGMSILELKTNKDSIKAEFDNEDRVKNGEFFTPVMWAKEAHKYFDKHVPDWKSGKYAIWDGSAGVGNLLRIDGFPKEKMFLSTLQDSDVKTIQNTEFFKGAHVFQCNFCSNYDYDIYNTEFLNTLDPELKDIILNDKPLIILMNPPYKAISASDTDVGSYMSSIGMGKDAFDIYNHFWFRVTQFVEMYNLHNLYFGVFGTLSIFVGENSRTLLNYIEHCFEFKDGMCLSSTNFAGTNEDSNRGIAFTLWKARGGYVGTESDNMHKDIILDVKSLNEGQPVTIGKMLYEKPREKLSHWVRPKDNCGFSSSAPMMTNITTFKGGNVDERIAPRSGKLRDDALGILMCGNNASTRDATATGVLSSCSPRIEVPIVKENFWRCVASYTFRNINLANWANAKKEFSAPNTGIEGYDKWVKNGLIMMLFDYKARTSGVRGVQWEGTVCNIYNKLFPLTVEEFKASCHDVVILRDFEKNGFHNEYILSVIEEVKKDWTPEVVQFYDWCKKYIMDSYDQRYKAYNNTFNTVEEWNAWVQSQPEGFIDTIQYSYGLEACDAGLQQVRSFVWAEEIQLTFSKLLSAVRDYLRQDVMKFGFVTSYEDFTAAVEETKPSSTLSDLMNGFDGFDDDTEEEAEPVETEPVEFEEPTTESSGVIAPPPTAF